MENLKQKIPLFSGQVYKSRKVIPAFLAMGSGWSLERSFRVFLAVTEIVYTTFLIPSYLKTPKKGVAYDLQHHTS